VTAVLDQILTSPVVLIVDGAGGVAATVREIGRPRPLGVPGRSGATLRATATPCPPGFATGRAGTGAVMPLVRIDVQSGRTPAELRTIADVVQQAMLDVFAAPPRDRYQIITEHPVGHIIAEDTGLGLDRSAGVMVVQIFQQGRSEAEKKALYAELAQQLAQQCAVRPEDLIVSITANERADWSFGMGRAQFLEGDL